MKAIAQVWLKPVQNSRRRTVWRTLCIAVTTIPSSKKKRSLTLHRRTRHALELWQSLGLGRVPTINRFKPHHFPALLPHLFIANVADRIEDYFVHQAGAAVEAAYGHRLTGLLFNEIDLGPHTETVVRDYAVCARERVAIFSRQWFKIGDSGPFERDRLLLPLDACESSQVARVVATLFYRRLPTETSRGSISLWIEEERRVVTPVW